MAIDITLRFSDANLAEVKAALQRHKNSDDNQSTADVKAWITKQVQGIVTQHRTVARDAASPVSSTSVVS